MANKVDIKLDKQFIVRFAGSKYEEFEELKHVTQNNILEYYYKSKFSETLLTLSNNLYKSISDKLNNKQVESLMKYMLRSSVRTTPFGLASGIGLGEFDAVNSSSFKTSKKVKPDYDWMLALCAKIKNTLGDEIFLKKSNTLIDYKSSLICNWNTSKKSKGVSTLDKTSVVEFVLNETDSFISKNLLKNKIRVQFGEVSSDILENFLNTLIDNGVLISDLDISLTHPDYLESILGILAHYNYEHYEDLKLIHLSINHLSDSIIDFETEYLNLINKMEELQKAKQYLHTDLYTKTNFSMDESERDKIESFAEFLLSNSYKSNKFEDFINHFDEYYGEGIAVNIRDLFNHPVLNKHIVKTENKNTERLMLEHLLTNAIISSKDEVDLSDYLNDDNLDDVDYDCGELGFYTLKTSSGIKYIVSPFLGTNTGLSSLGRFSYLFEPDEKITKRKQNEVDVSFLPKDRILGNVLFHEETGLYTLHYGCYSNSKSTEINLDNIYLFTYEKKIYFIDKSLNKIVDFYSTSRTNITYYPDVLRFLIEATVEKYNNILSLYECVSDIYKNICSAPRICWKDIIIKGKTWNFISKDCSSLNSFKEQFHDFSKKYSLPNEYFIELADNRLLINSNNPIMFNILYNEFKKERKLTIIENLFTVDSLFCKNKNEHFVTEFIFQIHNDKTKLQSPPASIKYYNKDVMKENIFYPFDEWLSFKIYAKKENFNQLLFKYVSPFTKLLSNADIIEKYFYIRYVDSGEHLRIRLKIKSASDLISEWTKFIQKIKIEPLVNDIALVPYQREYYRYGENYIDLFESIFYFDSLYSVDLLKNIDNTNLDIQCLAYVLLMIKLLLFLDYTEDEVQNLLSYFKNKNRSFVQEKYKKYKSVFMDLENVQKYAYTGLNSNVFMLQKNYIENMGLLKMLKSKIAQNDYNKILLSLFHMSFNRLIGIDRELENKCMALIESVLYKKFGREKYIKNECN